MGLIGLKRQSEHVRLKLIMQQILLENSELKEQWNDECKKFFEKAERNQVRSSKEQAKELYQFWERTLRDIQLDGE